MLPKIVAICGSLRPNSSNHAVLDIAQKYLIGKAEVQVYNGIGSLPHFDDNPNPGDAVTHFRALLKEADAVLICSPEYAFGIPGSLKNAIDWTVSSGELVYKPLCLITAATSGDKAHAAWLQVFQALSANFENSTLLLPFIRSKMNGNNIVDPATIIKIHQTLDGLLATIEKNNTCEAN